MLFVCNSDKIKFVFKIKVVSCTQNIRGSFRGCNSGYAYMAYNYVKLFGISTSEQYPYTSLHNGHATSNILFNITITLINNIDS